MRRFEFHDAKSDKFWEIEIQKDAYTVRYGRIGTDGQTKTKSFDTDEKAQKEHDKQIANKVKKGYQEVSAESSPKLEVVVSNAAEPQAKKTAKAKKAVTKPVETTPVQPENTPLPMDADADLGLSPSDEWFATWKTLPRIVPPAPEPFDQEKCVASLKQLTFVQNDYWKLPQWQRFPFPAAMSKEEAHFWWHVMVPEKHRMGSVKDIREHVSKGTYTGKVTLDEVKKISDHYSDPGCMRPLYFLLSADELLDVALAPGARTGGISALACGFRYVVPYLTEEECERLKARLLPDIAVSNWPTDHYSVPSAFIVAAALGMSDALLPVVESWPDKQYSGDEWLDHYHQPQRIIFGLGAPELVSMHMRRLKLKLREPDYIKGWIAHTGVNELDYPTQTICQESNKHRAAILVKTLGDMKHPAAAHPMLTLTTKSKAGGVAKQWLQENLGFAIKGLSAAMVEPNKEIAEWLRTQRRLGHEAAIKACMADLPESATARIQTEVLDYADPADNPFNDENTPAWLTDALSALAGALPKVVKAKPAGWISPPELPPIVVDGACLNVEQVEMLLKTLKVVSVRTPNPLIDAVKANADAQSLETFSWKLFEAWLAEGSPSKEKWALLAMGHLGGDECALKITPLIRQWPGESQHQRAVAGLDVLRGIGTETALMQLNGISQKVKFKGIKTRAKEVMELIAKERGMSKDALEDLLVPDCGLDEKGQRIFDFGPRQFTFVLGSDLKPKVKDEKGKVKDNLPKPNAKDDATIAAETVKEWKLIKKQIREAAKIQAIRLEAAMVVGRRWAPDKFETLLARHPLMTHICRPLLFGGFDAEGVLMTPFRITEEQDFADAEDEPVTLDGFTTIGIVHPLLLSDAQKKTWGEMFSDYELIPPFEQLGRPVYSLTDEEKSQNDLARFHKLSWPSPTLVFGLEKMGWVRGEPMDAGCFDEHSKQFPASGVTAVIFYEGCVSMGYIDPDEPLTLTGTKFIKGMRAPSGYGWGHEKEQVLSLGEVDPIVITEVIKDLKVLEAKAK